MKSMIWIIGVCVVSIGVFIFLLLGDTQKSVPKIQLSYFVDAKEVAESIEKRLDQEIGRSDFFWIGIEPDKLEELDVVFELKQQLERGKPFATVIADQELALKKEWLEKLKVDKNLMVKDNIKEVANLLGDLEKNNQRYLLITASIYSTPVILKNQIHQIKEIRPIRPLTFSFAYFPVQSNYEGSMLFPCNTEDHAGVSDWGCAIANKARFIRRKINEKNTKPWIGSMDLIGENDYMVLLYKK